MNRTKHTFIAATSQQPSYFRVIKSSDDDTDELLLYGYIGDWGYEEEDDMTAVAVVKAIRECDKKRRPF